MVDGGVGVAGSDATSKLDLKAASATLDLVPKPATREADGGRDPAAEAASPIQSLSTKPAKDRELVGSLERVTLAGDVRATAEELAAGELSRSFDLRSASLVATPAGGQDVAVVIDTPGQMLYRDLRPPAATTQPADKEQGPAAGFRGNAAFGWNDRLDWSPGDGVMTMTGRATVAVEPTDRPRFTLAADRFRVVTRKAGDRRDLASAAADGAATFTTKNLKFDAAHVDYDPLAQTVTARGAPASPVVVFDDRGVPTGPLRHARLQSRHRPSRPRQRLQRRRVADQLGRVAVGVLEVDALRAVAVGVGLLVGHMTVLRVRVGRR